MARKFDYTWRCDCDKEGTTQTLEDARKEAAAHLKEHADKTPNWTVYIDQYDIEAGELSDRYYKIEKNHSSLQRVWN